jgi:PBP1b-binding outer membrane lipoprotein LpoB
MKKFLQIAGIVFVVLLLIGYFSSKDDAKTSTDTSTKTEISTPAKPAIEIISQNFINSEIGPKVVTEIKNNTNKAVTYIDLKSVFYDANNTIIGTGFGNATDIPAGQTKTIDILTMDNISAGKRFKVEIGNVMYE